MFPLIKRGLLDIWNRMWFWRGRTSQRDRGLSLGYRVSDGQVTGKHLVISQLRRTSHIAVLGKTGTGKSSLLRYLSQQDIMAGHGFVYFDLHGDATPFLLATIAAREAAIGYELSENLIVIDPADPEFSVGLNFLEQDPPSFIRIAEFSQILKQRWGLEYFGARTDELLRNSLYALAENRLTLLELTLFLANTDFRTACLKRVTNAEVKQYFELRYDRTTEAMQAVMREPILTRTTAFTADPQFRHILGQQNSTVSVLDAMDQGKWIILNLHKGRLSEHGITLGSLFLTLIKNALFARRERQLFTLYCDEIQDLVFNESGIETVLSEARKFGVAVISANQFLDQHSQRMRSAILAVGTHVFFQLSGNDAHRVASLVDGGRPLAELLKNLPRRQMVVKSGHERWQEVLVPTVHTPKVSYADLYDRCRTRWARRRSAIEEQITARQAQLTSNTDEALREWG